MSLCKAFDVRQPMQIANDKDFGIHQIITHRSDAKVSYGCIIDVDRVVFFIGINSFSLSAACMHRWTGKIGLNNGLLPIRHQAIIEN